MNKYITSLIFAIIVLFSFNSCLDTNDEDYQNYLKEVEEYNKKVYAQFQVDSTLIADYVAVNDTLAKFYQGVGIFYTIVEPGGEYHPNLESAITIHYKGSLLDGTVFDQTKEGISVEFYLGNLISGWQYGLPLIGSGGKIILYLPSVFGYGSQQAGTIPPNSVLIFEIDLVSYYTI